MIATTEAVPVYCSYGLKSQLHIDVYIYYEDVPKI